MTLHPDNKTVWEPVAIPLAKGLDLRTRARLVDATKLLVAENVAFPATAGVSKRYGHKSKRVRGAEAIPGNTTIAPAQSGLQWSDLYAEKTLPSNWLYGWGLFDPATPYVLNGSPSTNQVSPHPDAGILCGAATRDNEELAWNGFRLYSSANQPDGGAFGEPAKSTGSSLAAPFGKTSPVAKAGTSQAQPGVADTGVVKVVTWLEGTVAKASVYDSVTGAPIRLSVNLAAETGFAITAVGIKCVPVGQWVHILVSESANHKLYRITVNGAAAGATFTKADLGACQGAFDVRKISSSSWAVVMEDTSNQAVLTYLDASGNALTTLAPQRKVLVTTTAHGLGFDIHPATGDICLMYRDSATAAYMARSFTSNGTPYAAAVNLAAGTFVGVDVRMTVGAVYTQNQFSLTGYPQAMFVCFWETGTSSVSGGQAVQAKLISVLGTTGALVDQPDMYLASQAFRVGNYPFVIGAYKSTFQSTFFVLDTALLPVGKFEYGTAAVTTGGATEGWLTTVNFKDGAAAKDRLVFHTALRYNLRLSSNTNVAVYAEPGIKECYLDFLPRLRSAQAGRCTYFAGAQLWNYDGRTCVEAGFHLGTEPANVGLTPSNAGGGLTNSATYQYYVQPAYRNAQGEEVRGPGFFTNTVTMGAADNTVTVTIRKVLTRRPDAYFLVYRREATGVLWYLVSSRDPASASCPKNPTTAATVTFTDTVADTALINNELAPSNPAGYLETYSSPACEVIGSGKQRLWTAGGEIPPGQVFPSRLFYPGQVPSFNPSLSITVDRSADAITAIGFVEDLAVIFRKDHTHIQDGTGPDNLSGGGWPEARQAMAEVGCLEAESLGLIPAGLVFRSAAGFRLVSPGGGLQPIGLDVDPLAQDAHISAAVVIPDDQQIRFYQPDGPALVYDYLQDCWSTWTGLYCWGAVRPLSSRRAVLATTTGNLWTETEGYYNDGGTLYAMRIRTAWLHAGQLGSFQRVRRYGGLGELPGGHFELGIKLYYDERDFYEEERLWLTSDDLNSSTWGSSSWGDGWWGNSVDTSITPRGSAAPVFQDHVLRYVFRTNRQKCSAISIELTDGCVDGPGFIGTAILLEIGAKGGLDRIPWRNNSARVSFTPGS